MFETAGTLTIVELVSSLVALVILPLVWAAIAALSEIRSRFTLAATRLAVAGAGGTLLLAAVHAFRAFASPDGQIAQQHVATLARTGQLDISLDLVRDPTSASCAVLAALIGFAAVLHAVWTAPAKVAGRLAWTGLATASVILVSLADGMPTLALGLQIATIAGWALAGGGRTRTLVLALAGDITLVFAAWVLFWSLGGTFSTSGYTPDPLPRFAIVAVPEAARADAKASVALTTYPDALVTSDDGPPLPGEPLRAPFLLVLDPGVYSFRIAATGATADMLVTHVTLGAGRSYVLTPYGPTTSLSNLDDQLSVPRPSPTGPTSMRATLASRVFGGIRVASVVGVFAVLAALLRLVLLGKTQQGGLAFALEAIPPVVIAIHILPLLDPAAALDIAVLPAFAAILLAGEGAAARSSDRVPRAVVAALAALAMASVLASETGGAMVILVAASLGGAAATTALDAETDIRWLGMACASLAGVLPGAGASPGISSAMAGAVNAGVQGRVAGYIVAALLAVAALLVSLSIFRVYGASMRQPLKDRGARGSRWLAFALAVLSLAGGAVLGLGSSQFGGTTVPLARRLVDAPGGVDNIPKVMAAALLVAFLCAVVGVASARRATSQKAPGWLDAFGAPSRLASRASLAASGLVRFFVRSVLVMNEDVVEDATDAVASLFLRFGGGKKRSAAAVSRPLGTTESAAVVSSVDSPREGILKTALVLGMVAILGLVVLSSVVLG